MFEKIINWIKGALSMFKTNNIAKEFNIDISSNDEVLKLIDECTKIYNGKAPWLNKEVKSLNVAKTICDRVAKAVTIEFKSKVEDLEINEVYQKFLKNIRVNTEYTLAKGGMFFKPFFSNGKIKISCIQGDMFIPVKFDSTGELLGAIFIEQIVNGKDIYTRIEHQELTETTLIIKNKAYKGNGNTLGTQVPLSIVDQWKNIGEIVGITNVNKLIGGYFKIPIANTKDNTSPIGVPIFTNSIGTLEEIDKQFSRTLWEFEGSELAIDIDETLLKKDENGNTIYPKGKERLYRKLDIGDEAKWNVFNPDIRETPLFNGLNELLRQVESQLSLSFGTLSKINETEKTATEIRSSKQDYYVTVSDVQGALQTALEDLIYGIDILMTLYKVPHKTNPDISFDWDDSILVDSKEKQSQSLVERNASLIDDVEYFVQTRDYSEEEAIEYVNKMRERASKMNTTPTENEEE